MARPKKDAEPPVMSAAGAGAEKAAFVSRLQTILAHWPSADRLARAIGVSPSAFRKWLKGEAEPSRERLVALGRATGVGIAWLAEGNGPAPTFEPVVGSRRRPGSHDATADADWSHFVLLTNRSNESEPVAVRQDWIRSTLGIEPSHVLLEIASGEAMAPTIRNGDTLLVDTTDRMVRDTGIYVLEINGCRQVKRVQRKYDGSLVLISDNAVYQPDVVGRTDAENVAVVGRVVWTGGFI